MNIIPQTPPIKVTVTQTDICTDGDEVTTFTGRIVAWQIQPDDDLADLAPIIWADGDPRAYAISNGMFTGFRVEAYRPKRVEGKARQS